MKMEKLIMTIICLSLILQINRPFEGLMMTHKKSIILKKEELKNIKLTESALVTSAPLSISHFTVC